MTPTLVPPLHVITPTNLSVPRGWRQITPCVIDRFGITWGDQRVTFEEVTSIAYGARSRSLNLVQRRTERRICLGTQSGNWEVILGVRAFGPNHDAAHLDAYNSLMAALHSHVEPRLRAAILREIAAGGSVPIGALRLDRSGVYSPSTGITVEWRQLPVAQLEQDHVAVQATIEHPERGVACIPILSPNAVLLPELLAEAVVPFS